MEVALVATCTSPQLRAEIFKSPQGPTSPVFAGLSTEFSWDGDEVVVST